MNRWWLLAGLWLLYTAFGLTAAGIAPLVLQIEKELGITHAAMGSIMGAWQLTYIFAAMPGGILLAPIAIRFKSFLPCFLVHYFISLGNDIAAIYFHFR